MKKINGILGASLAGFAALTMAAITTTTTEAIAFQGGNTRVKAPAQVGSTSPVRRVPANTTATQSSMLVTPRLVSPRDQQRQPVFHQHRRKTVYDLPLATDTTNRGSVSDPEFKYPQMPNDEWETLKHVFEGQMIEELLTPLPEGVDPGKIPDRRDGPDKEQGRGIVLEGTTIVVPRDNTLPGNATDGADAGTDGADAGADGGTDGMPFLPDEPGTPHGADVGGSIVTDDGSSEGLHAATNGAAVAGEGTPQGKVELEEGQPEPRTTHDKVERDPKPEGDDPDEIRNNVRDENLNVAGMESAVAMRDGTGSGQEGTPGTSPQKPDGSEWERHRLSIGGRGAVDPEGIIDPAEMANPMGTNAAAFNHKTGQANSPTVDGAGKGPAPPGPVEPVADQVE